jgi:hypothetical protein
MNHLVYFFFLIGLNLSYLMSVERTSTLIPRTLLVLYNSEIEQLEETSVHQFAEMPLNHLGLKLDYYDIQLGLPNIEEREDIIGILTWFPRFATTPNPEKYLNWSIRAMLGGKKFVVMGHPGFQSSERETFLYLTNQFWEVLGLQDTGRRIIETTNAEIVFANSQLISFEKALEGNFPSFSVMIQIDPQLTTSFLTAKIRLDPTSLSQLIVIGPHGGYVAEDFAVYKTPLLLGIKEIRKWLINPFEFFRLVFHTDSLPKPDTTTLAGRRIYYSHIDGDGWNISTKIEKYKVKNRLASYVIYREILKNYSDLPVTVGPIGAEISLDWVGSEESRAVARRIFRLSNVEVGCHTLSHPFQWEFFNSDSIKKENVFLSQYSLRRWDQKHFVRNLMNLFPKPTFSKIPYSLGWVDQATFPYASGQKVSIDTLPRAYALKPFDLRLEVFGALREVRSVANQPVALYQWSGDCLPFERVIQLTRQAAVRNLNGGATRFDEEAHSYAWVSPIGRQVGNQQQVYASNASEEVYTHSWERDPGAFTKVQETFANTESPIRIKPINLHYHMYSGEKEESLKAIKQNLDYIQAKEVIPIEASRFAAIVSGFYSTQIRLIERNSWRIEQRGELQTIRFDDVDLKGVDFFRSIGVIGQRHFQGSLYVYLDASYLLPVITLKNVTDLKEESVEEVPYLIQSSWRIWGIQNRKNGSFNFVTQGYGKGIMQWQVPETGWYLVTLLGETEEDNEELEIETEGNRLHIEFDVSAIDPIAIRLEKLLDENSDENQQIEENEKMDD